MRNFAKNIISDDFVSKYGSLDLIFKNSFKVIQGHFQVLNFGETEPAEQLPEKINILLRMELLTPEFFGIRMIKFILKSLYF